MLTAAESRLLADLQDFFSVRRADPVIETLLPLILPSGSSAAFATDSEGRVAGLKFAGPPEPQLLLKLLMQFKHLQRLVFYASDSADVSIPPEIGQLKNLRFMVLSGGIKRLPEAILELGLPIIVQLGPQREIRGRLEDPDEHSVLLLRNNRRISVRLDPHNLERLDALNSVKSHLRELVERTEKSTTPPEQERLPLDLPEKISADLDEAAWLNQSLALSFVLLNDVTLEDPPLEIAAKGRDAIASYFRDRSSGYLPLNEVKILLVGNGSSGKTSLVKRLFGEQFNPQESQTHGINIRRLFLKSTVAGEVKANFWDFGGQEIMHATHQFFLSKRSVYILVLDGRKEEDPEYWLQHIESFGGESPVMVVLNKIDEHPAFDVNRRFLMSKYPSIVGFFRISCANEVGILEIKTAIQEQLERVPILQTTWPQNWFRVKQQLEELGTAYISVAQYTNLCEREGVADQASQETLVDFLHDLGVILHFRDLQLLDTHVLDPRWVTEGVYRIINSELLAKQKGLLRPGQLSGVLGSSEATDFRYSADKYGYIVELMLKFELCYKIGDGAILVPDLLDIQEPELDFDYEGALRFIFEYKYLPKSIMPRFMVRMHKDIRKAMRWRTGVELEDQAFSARAVVRSDEKAKSIYVFVNGKQKRDYFSAIRKVITDINSSFEKLEITELVPLPDVPEVSLDYKELIGHEFGGREEIFVGRLNRAYNVQLLLNGIEERSVRQREYQTVINVKGNYFAQPNIPQATFTQLDQSVSQSVIGGTKLSYQPQLWEKVLVYGTAILFTAVISFLIIRNQPIADPNLMVLARILLSLVVAVFGATVPGMLKVDLTSKKGLAIRATGALALFVLTFVETPRVLPH